MHCAANANDVTIDFVFCSPFDRTKLLVIVVVVVVSDVKKISALPIATASFDGHAGFVSAFWAFLALSRRRPAIAIVSYVSRGVPGQNCPLQHVRRNVESEHRRPFVIAVFFARAYESAARIRMSFAERGRVRIFVVVFYAIIFVSFVFSRIYRKSIWDDSTVAIVGRTVDDRTRPKIIQFVQFQDQLFASYFDERDRFRNSVVESTHQIIAGIGHSFRTFPRNGWRGIRNDPEQRQNDRDHRTFRYRSYIGSSGLSENVRFRKDRNRTILC